MSVTSKQCGKCEKVQSIKNNFFSAKNELLSKNGRMIICKECFLEQIDPSNMESLLFALRTLNVPFKQDFWNKHKDGKNAIGEYLRMFSQKQYKELTWEDSDNIHIPDISIPSNVDPDILSDDAKKRWIGFSFEEMMQLETDYLDWVHNYQADTPVERSIFQEIVTCKLMAAKSRSQGKHSDYKNYMEMYRSLAGDAKIKPNQDTGNKTEETIGLRIKMIEETEPIPEPLPEFKDVDGIGKYIRKWFVGHFEKMLGISKDGVEHG